MSNNQNTADRLLGATTNSKYHQARYRWYVVGLLGLVYAINFIDRQLLFIVQESIKLELNLSDSQLGLLTGFAFAIFYVTAGIPIARWSDRSNRRNIIAAATGLWSIMTAASALAGNFFHLVLARIGVGVGEAGCTPPAHSLISDVFPPEKRATALAVYSSGINVGAMIGFLLGGIINELYGWRIAFVVIGLPGVLVALIVRYTIEEPPRGFSESNYQHTEQPPLMKVVSSLWSNLTFRHMSMAAALSVIAAYGAISWSAPFMIRTYQMGTAELGAWLAFTTGFTAIVGTLLAGFFADRLSYKSKRWYMWIPACGKLLVAPFAFAVYSTTHSSAYVALVFLAFIGLFSATYFGPTVAILHGLVKNNERAQASAIFYFIINLIGLGMGPLLVGTLSDLLNASYGDHSLRIALLMTVPIFAVWSSFHFYCASRHVENELK